MSGVHATTYRVGVHPLHVVLLAGIVPLFVGALLSDVAYWRTQEIQWSNFASWLIVGALIQGAIVLVWSLGGLFRARHRGGRVVLYPALLIATWIAGLFDALVHARDAWAVMPAGLVWTAIALLLACAATAAGIIADRTGHDP